jgi:ABC-type sugar transport system substrate-binding protein
MNTTSLPFALMAAGLFLAAPAFAQTKQPTQEGAPATPQTASDYKQRTQEGAPATPQTAGDYKQRTQEGSPVTPQTANDYKSK